MYGLPENTDLRFFTNRVLLQVCLGANEAILRFDGDVSVTAQTDMGHKSAGVFTALYKTIIPSAAMLVRFLHTSVIGASVRSPGTLVLEFSNGEALELYDTSSDYESYQITYDGNTIVV
jgi:hypothetical protein